jgi:response regulator RpfG family c-di-GMP phosphodiesterase
MARKAGEFRSGNRACYRARSNDWWYVRRLESGLGVTLAGQGHRLEHYVRLLAEARRLDACEVAMLVRGARLHAAGEPGIGHGLPAGPGVVAMTQQVGLILRQHHDPWGGGDHEECLDARRMRRLACILGVADAFVTMTSERPYTPALPVEQALAVLADGAGRQWDPQVVEAWLELMAQSATSGPRLLKPQVVGR